VLGRYAFQLIPSVEPLTPAAVLIGFFFGPVAGFVSGASGFLASNFLVWGGQGPWTVFQSIGAGIAGSIGGMFGLGKKTRWKVLAATLIGVGLYELIVTAGLSYIFSFNLVFVAFYLLTSLPFSLVHIGSSVGFSFIFYEFREQIKRLRGGKTIEQEFLGLRVVDSDSDKHSSNVPYRFVPFFYSRRTIDENNGKSDSGFWSVKHIQNNENR
jgi:energy-coupling factor transport system substrate-specific component